MLSYCDNTDEPLAGMMRKGSAGSNTAADHITIVNASIEALPPAYRRRLMVTCDGAGASHDLITHLDKLASRPGRQLTYSVGWDQGKRERNAIRLVPGHAWQIAIDPRGEVRERRAEGGGPGGDQLAGWPESMRVFARRERPHPGAQLTLFEAEDGWRYSLWVTNLPAALRGWRANPAYIDAAHRVHARVEDRMRTGKETGIGHFPSVILSPTDDHDSDLRFCDVNSVADAAAAAA